MESSDFEQGAVPEPNQEQIDQLIADLKASDWGVRASAVLALWKAGPSAAAAVPALTETLTDTDKFIRGFSAHALWNIGSPAAPALPALIEALKDKDKYVCSAAAFALGDVGLPAVSAVPALTEILKDKDRDVRREAASSLWSIAWRVEGEVQTMDGPALNEALALWQNALAGLDTMVSKEALCASEFKRPRAVVRHLVEVLQREQQSR